MTEGVKHNKEKSPAFQFYPKDFLTDMKVICMSHEIRGMYITLLCIDWLEDGFPKEQMLSLCGGIALGEDQESVGINKARFIENSLMACFIKHPSKKGYLTNKRLLKEREKQGLYRQKQKENADMRWHKLGNAVAMPNACSSSSSSSSSPSSNNINKKTEKIGKDEDFDQLRHFEDFFKDYPKQIERSKALSVYCVLVTRTETHNRVVKALQNYRAHLEHENAESVWKKPKNPDKWLEGWMDWENFTPPPKEKKYASRSDQLIAKIAGK